MPTLVSKEQYFDEALRALAESGFAGVNIGLLCRGLGVTSGSFYHHFGSWDGFVAALLRFWEDRQVRTLRELAFGAGTPEQDIAALRTLTLGLHHEAEAAIRAWGMNDPAVRAVQHRVDRSRHATVHRAITRMVGDVPTATMLTSLGMTIVVGYQQLLAGGGQTDLATLLAEYTRVIAEHRSC